MIILLSFLVIPLPCTSSALRILGQFPCLSSTLSGHCIGRAWEENAKTTIGVESLEQIVNVKLTPTLPELRKE